MVKKNKRGRWNRADVKDVEAAIDEKRQLKQAEEKVGGLFKIDTVGNTAGLPKSVRKTLNKEKQVKGGAKLSALELKKIEKAKTTIENRIKQGLGATKVAGVPKPKPAAPSSQTLKKNLRKTDDVSLSDLWGPEPKKATPKEEKKRPNKFFALDEDEFIASKNRVNVMNKAQYKPQKAPNTLHQRTSAAPAVVVVGQGLSMNPGAEAYDEAVDEVVQYELATIEEQKAMWRKINPMTAKLQEEYSKDDMDKMDDAKKIHEYKRLMRGLTEEEMDELTEALSQKRTLETRNDTQKDRLTQAQRNKKRRVEDAGKEMSAAKKQKLLERSIGSVPNLLREMDRQAAEKKKAKGRVAELKLKKKKDEAKGVIKKGVKIGRGRFSEDSANFRENKLPQKASSGLRNTQVTSALVDRVKSIYRRNMAEMPPEISTATLQRVKRKAKRKTKATKHLNRNLLLA